MPLFVLRVVEARLRQVQRQAAHDHDPPLEHARQNIDQDQRRERSQPLEPRLRPLYQVGLRALARYQPVGLRHDVAALPAVDGATVSPGRTGGGRRWRRRLWLGGQVSGLVDPAGVQLDV